MFTFIRDAIVTTVNVISNIFTLPLFLPPTPIPSPEISPDPSEQVMPDQGADSSSQRLVVEPRLTDSHHLKTKSWLVGNSADGVGTVRGQTQICSSRSTLSWKARDLGDTQKKLKPKTPFKRRGMFDPSLIYMRPRKITRIGQSPRKVIQVSLDSVQDIQYFPYMPPIQLSCNLIELPPDSHLYGKWIEERDEGRVYKENLVMDNIRLFQPNHPQPPLDAVATPNTQSLASLGPCMQTQCLPCTGTPRRNSEPSGDFRESRNTATNEIENLATNEFEGLPHSDITYLSGMDSRYNIMAMENTAFEEDPDVVMVDAPSSLQEESCTTTISAFQQFITLPSKPWTWGASAITLPTEPASSVMESESQISVPSINMECDIEMTSDEVFTASKTDESLSGDSNLPRNALNLPFPTIATCFSSEVLGEFPTSTEPGFSSLMNGLGSGTGLEASTEDFSSTWGSSNEGNMSSDDGWSVNRGSKSKTSAEDFSWAWEAKFLESKSDDDNRNKGGMLSSASLASTSTRLSSTGVTSSSSSSSSSFTPINNPTTKPSWDITHTVETSEASSTQASASHNGKQKACPGDPPSSPKTVSKLMYQLGLTISEAEEVLRKEAVSATMDVDDYLIVPQPVTSKVTPEFLKKIEDFTEVAKGVPDQEDAYEEI